MNIAVLLTCHNRKDKTLHCLSCFFHQEKPLGVTFDIYLVDDGSSDGTSEAVKSLCDKIHIIEGDGTLFWNRGMHKAWSTALASRVNYDGVLWLNDDTILNSGAIVNLCTNIREGSTDIIVGTTCNTDDHNIITYGASFKGTMLSPSETPQLCDNFNGNFVYVPRVVYNQIGILDYYYRHSMGDFDYAMRAHRAGYKCIVLPVVGTCDRNSPIAKWMKGNIIQRYKALYSPLGNSPLESFHYFKKFSYMRAISVFVYMHFRVLSTFLKN